VEPNTNQPPAPGPTPEQQPMPQASPPQNMPPTGAPNPQMPAGKKGMPFKTIIVIALVVLAALAVASYFLLS